MGAKPDNLHIVLFPLMAQGHLIPFLALADFISRRHPSLPITLLTTPLNAHALRSSLHPAIRLHPLPFDPAVHGLPADAENTDRLPVPLIIRFFEASESLRPAFHSFLAAASASASPLCVVADVLLSWTVDVSKAFGVFHATFTTSGAFGTASYFSLWIHLPHLKTTESPEFHLPGFPDDFRVHRSQMSSYMRSATGADPWSVFFRRQILSSLRSDAILCNTVEETEVFGLQLLRSIAGLRVWPVGPLLPLDSSGLSQVRRSGRTPGIDLESCIRWLDAHRPCSVIYVSFGSQNTIAASQMEALARGLEASGASFVWVVRPPLGADLNGEIRDEWLPEGFEQRAREAGRGLLVRRWAPQLEILSHGAVGGFLSHCGWNSVLESLSRGVPLVGWPLAAEQFYNSMMLEELEVGVEVARGVVDEVESAQVERVIRLVMTEEKGRRMREKARACSEKIKAAIREEEGKGKGSSIAALDDFIQTVMNESSRAQPEASL